MMVWLVRLVWLSNTDCTCDLSESIPAKACVQACMPSNHVYSAFAFPALPHFLYQAPPGAQQLRLPDFLLIPHFGHTELGLLVMVVVAAADVINRLKHNKSIDNKKGEIDIRCFRVLGTPLTVNLLAQA